MQCMENLGCFPQRKQAAIVQRYPAFLPVCSVFVLPTTSCEAYSFTTDGYVIFNVHTNLGARHTHEGGSGTNKSAQELT